MRNKKNKTNKTMVNPFFVLGLLDNNHAFGGELGDPPVSGTTPTVTPAPTTPPIPKMIPNPNYAKELALYNDSLNVLNTSPYDTDLLDRTGNETLYDTPHPEFPNMKPERVYKSKANENWFFNVYPEPQKLVPNPAYKEPVEPKVGRYLDPHTRQPLSIEEYGSPGTEDVQLSQGLELESMKLSNQAEAAKRAAEIQKNKELLKTLTPEQLAEARSLKLTPEQYLARNNQMANGGYMENPLETTLPPMDYEHVNVKGNTAKGAAQGALSGASMGMAAGPWGALAGAVIGGVAGGITSNKAAKKEAEYNQGIFESNAGNVYEYLKQDDMMLANGGPLSIDNIEGPRHEEGGVGIASSEVEGGEAKLGNYIFSDRLKPKGSKRTFSQKAKAIELKYKERDNDAPAQKSKAKELESLMAENEIARKAAEYQERQITNDLMADAFAYGGRLKCDNGGRIIVDPKDRDLFKSLAKKRNMSLEEYGNKLLALGGPLDLEPFPYEDIVRANNVLNPNLDINRSSGIEDIYKLSHNKQEPSITSEAQNMDHSIFNAPELTDEEINQILDGDNTKILNDETSTKKFGNEEYALIASMAPAIDNLFESASNKSTHFNRVLPSLIDMDSDRELVRRNITKARNTARENVRSNATSSGQALSNMAAMNADLTDKELQALMEIGQNEKTANAQIINNNRATNAEIGMQETIANEQNQDLRRSLKNKAIADIATNSQMYMRDKKLTSENQRQNQRIVDMINSMGYNYKWEDDNGEFALKFIKLLEEKNG